MPNTAPLYTLVALMGPAGAGKTTAQRYLEAQHGFKARAFADPIKCMLEGLLVDVDADWAHLHEPHLKLQPIAELGGLTARQLMTSLGDWGRSLHPTWWIDATARALGLPHAPVAPRLVVSDVRYPNEAAWVRAMGGRIWRIQRSALPDTPAHSSEWAQENISADLTLYNNGEVADLHRQLAEQMALLHVHELAQRTKAAAARAEGLQ